MKKLLSYLFLSFTLSLAFSQNPSAILDLESNSQGVLVPRMSYQEVLNITDPADGLLVYAVDKFWYFAEGLWNPISTNAFFQNDFHRSIHSVRNDYDFIVGSHTTDHLDNGFDDRSKRMFWHNAKRAFRVGSTRDTVDFGLDLVSGDPLVWDSDSIGYYSFASGIGTKAKGQYTFATGRENEAIGNYSFAGGIRSKAIGHGSVALGYENETHGLYSMSSGRSNYVIGEASVALGYNNDAIGDYALVFGNNSEANNLYSIAIGNNAISDGVNAFALGEGTAAQGDYSLALGKSSIASGDYSSATGLGSNANGTASIAMGNVSFSFGDNSVALGDNNITNCQGCVALGQYSNAVVGPNANTPDDPLFIIGNGTTSARNNALVLKRKGFLGLGTNDPGSILHMESDADLRMQMVSNKTTDPQVKLDFIRSGNRRDWRLLNDTIGVFKIGYSNDLQDDNHTATLELSPSRFSPASNGTVELGLDDHRWETVWITNGINSSSDARLKKNIHVIDYGLDEVMHLRPVRYQWKQNDKEKKLGLLAQEVLEVIPEVVHVPNDPDAYLGMDYAELIPVLINAIQELKHEVEELKQQ